MSATGVAATGVAAADADEAGRWVRHSFSRPAMGTVFRIDVYAGTGKDEEAAMAGAVEAAFGRVEAINQIASDYLPESELSRLNLAPVQEPVKVSADLFALISQAVEISRRSGGAFDVTAAYSIQHWRRARRQKKLPDAERIRQAMALTDWRALRLDETRGLVTKLREGLRLDLGGIGKGYAADAALAVLRERGFPRALVAGSGDLAIGDPPPGETGWRVALRTFEAPEEGDRPVHLTLARCGCSTSGDLHQYLELGGVRYSHIVNPRTGLGLTDRIACTVIAPTAARSDALATALCVIGPEAGATCGEAMEGVAARFVWMEERDGGRLRRLVTAGWPAETSAGSGEPPARADR